jgi:hypothetical protein
MSQRSKSVDETMLINLQVKVNLESFSNHDGFKDGQIEKAIEAQNQPSCLGALMELDVNHTFWSEALSTIDKNKLIELCEYFKIPTKGKDRYRLASNLSKRIDLNKRMKIVVGFE